MLLGIGYKPEDVVVNEEGLLVLEVHHYGPYANAIHLVSVKGCSAEDYEKRECLKSKSVLVGVRGGLSIE